MIFFLDCIDGGVMRFRYGGSVTDSSQVALLLDCIVCKRCCTVAYVTMLRLSRCDATNNVCLRVGRDTHINMRTHVRTHHTTQYEKG